MRKGKQRYLAHLTEILWQLETMEPGTVFELGCLCKYQCKTYPGGFRQFILKAPYCRRHKKNFRNLWVSVDFFRRHIDEEMQRALGRLKPSYRYVL